MLSRRLLAQEPLQVGACRAALILSVVAELALAATATRGTSPGRGGFRSSAPLLRSRPSSAHRSPPTAQVLTWGDPSGDRSRTSSQRDDIVSRGDQGGGATHSFLGRTRAASASEQTALLQPDGKAREQVSNVLRETEEKVRSLQSGISTVAKTCAHNAEQSSPDVGDEALKLCGTDPAATPASVKKKNPAVCVLERKFVPGAEAAGHGGAEGSPSSGANERYLQCVRAGVVRLMQAESAPSWKLEQMVHFLPQTVNNLKKNPKLKKNPLRVGFSAPLLSFVFAETGNELSWPHLAGGTASLLKGTGRENSTDADPRNELAYTAATTQLLEEKWWKDEHGKIVGLSSLPPRGVVLAVEVDLVEGGKDRLHYKLLEFVLQKQLRWGVDRFAVLAFYQGTSSSEQEEKADAAQHRKQDEKAGPGQLLFFSSFELVLATEFRVHRALTWFASLIVHPRPPSEQAPYTLPQGPLRDQAALGAAVLLARYGVLPPALREAYLDHGTAAFMDRMDPPQPAFAPYGGRKREELKDLKGQKFEANYESCLAAPTYCNADIILIGKRAEQLAAMTLQTHVEDPDSAVDHLKNALELWTTVSAVATRGGGKPNGAASHAAPDEVQAFERRLRQTGGALLELHSEWDPRDDEVRGLSSAARRNQFRLGQWWRRNLRHRLRNWTKTKTSWKVVGFLPISAAVDAVAWARDTGPYMDPDMFHACMPVAKDGTRWPVDVSEEWENTEPNWLGTSRRSNFLGVVCADLGLLAKPKRTICDSPKEFEAAFSAKLQRQAGRVNTNPSPAPPKTPTKASKEEETATVPAKNTGGACVGHFYRAARCNAAESAVLVEHLAKQLRGQMKIGSGLLDHSVRVGRTNPLEFLGPSVPGWTPVPPMGNHSSVERSVGEPDYWLASPEGVELFEGGKDGGMEARAGFADMASRQIERCEGGRGNSTTKLEIEREQARLGLEIEADTTRNSSKEEANATGNRSNMSDLMVHQEKGSSACCSR